MTIYSLGVLFFLFETSFFSNDSALRIRWPKYWSFSFNISPSSEYSELIAFMICCPRDSQESSPAPHFKNISCSALSFLYSPTHMITRKTIALTIQTFVGKVASLLFNALSRFVIAFFPKEQPSFNFMAAVTICSDSGAQKNKVWHCFHCFHIYLPWSDGTGCHDLRFLNVEQ